MKLVLIGAGGFGREALDVVEAENAAHGGGRYELLGVVDDSPTPENLRRLSKRGAPYLGKLSENHDWPAGGVHFLIGIGNPQVRKAVSSMCEGLGLTPAIAIHPSAVIGSDFTAGPGTVICAGVQISTNVSLGEHVHINPGVVVGHDAELESFVSINPGSIVSGNVRVETGSLLGAGSVVLQGLKIGSNAVVGAGAVVVRDVPGSVIVKGVPAR